MKPAWGWSLALALAAGGGWMAATAWNTPAQSEEPRLPQLQQSGLTDDQKPLADYIMKFSATGIGGPYNVMLRSPGAAKPLLELLDYLRWHTSVPTRLNEFAILIQGRLWRSQVEWSVHYALALKAGLPQHVADDLKAGKRPSDMQPDEAAVYDFCMELYTRHTVSDATYAQIKSVFNDQQIVDLMMVSGTYVNLAAMMNGANQGLPPGKELAFKPGEP